MCNGSHCLIDLTRSVEFINQLICCILLKWHVDIGVIFSFFTNSNDAYFGRKCSLIGCSLLSQLISRYWKTMGRQLYILSCPIDCAGHLKRGAAGNDPGSLNMTSNAGQREKHFTHTIKGRGTATMFKELGMQSK